MAQKEGHCYAFFYQNTIISKMGIAKKKHIPSLTTKGKKKYFKACWNSGPVIFLWNIQGNLKYTSVIWIFGQMPLASDP